MINAAIWAEKTENGKRKREWRDWRRGGERGWVGEVGDEAISFGAVGSESSSWTPLRPPALLQFMLQSSAAAYSRL